MRRNVRVLCISRDADAVQHFLESLSTPIRTCQIIQLDKIIKWTWTDLNCVEVSSRFYQFCYGVAARCVHWRAHSPALAHISSRHRSDSGHQNYRLDGRRVLREYREIILYSWVENQDKTYLLLHYLHVLQHVVRPETVQKNHKRGICMFVSDRVGLKDRLRNRSA
ncbi:hypothetical protein ABKN59_002384 [Abortiporus biennis]